MSWQLVSPRDYTPLITVSETERRSSTEQFHQVDGIWRMLLPEREAALAQFMREYETVRTAEKRGSLDSAYYRALPYRDVSGVMAGAWRIRGIGYDHFVETALPLVSPKAKIIDIGAGNGWLSGRLAARGYDVAAVDLLVNKTDGLGAFTHYETPFLPIQAEFERVPLAAESAEMVIFNASFHYAESYERVLTEAFRMVKPLGYVVVLDTPVYSQQASGDAMVVEREAQFEQRYGFKSDGQASENFLTKARIAQLADAFGIKWQMSTPAYDLKWRLRPLRARLRGHREPATFPLLIAQKT